MLQRIGSGRLALELALIIAVAPAACGFNVVTASLDGAPGRKAQPRYDAVLRQSGLQRVAVARALPPHGHGAGRAGGHGAPCSGMGAPPRLATMCVAALAPDVVCAVPQLGAAVSAHNAPAARGMGASRMPAASSLARAEHAVVWKRRRRGVERCAGPQGGVVGEL
jgi:hypothetical protein